MQIQAFWFNTPIKTAFSPVYFGKSKAIHNADGRLSTLLMDTLLKSDEAQLEKLLRPLEKALQKGPVKVLSVKPFGASGKRTAIQLADGRQYQFEIEEYALKPNQRKVPTKRYRLEPKRSRFKVPFMTLFVHGGGRWKSDAGKLWGNRLQISGQTLPFLKQKTHYVNDFPLVQFPTQSPRLKAVFTQLENAISDWEKAARK